MAGIIAWKRRGLKPIIAVPVVENLAQRDNQVTLLAAVIMTKHGWARVRFMQKKHKIFITPSHALSRIDYSRR